LCDENIEKCGNEVETVAKISQERNREFRNVSTYQFKSRIVGSAINILEELCTQLLKTFDRQQSCCCIIRVKNEETTKNEIERTLCCMIRKRGHNKVVGGDSCDTINLVSSTPTALKEK
jgi:hypothetical protein